MSIFDKNSTGRQLYFPRDGHFGRKPDITDKLEMLFTDVETKGKKQGYAKAAAEYEKAFDAIKSEYKYTKYLLNSSRNMHEKQSSLLIQKLKSLEQKREELEKRLDEKTKDVSKKYNIPVQEVRGALVGGYRMGSETFGLLDLVYSVKERKLQEAERRGYLEAKELYEAKITELKNGLAVLKEKGDKEIRELIDMSNDILEAIADEQMKIAELNILL